LTPKTSTTERLEFGRDHCLAKQIGFIKWGCWDISKFGGKGGGGSLS